VKQVASQLTLAAKLCIDIGIAHRDIKLSNITFPKEEAYSTSDGQLYVKLADFGMAGFKDIDNQLKGRCGTPGWFFNNTYILYIYIYIYIYTIYIFIDIF
jgi:calcium/calmodulin-dependent protein kinase I